MTTPITSQPWLQETISEARLDLLDLLEEVGSAAGLLREGEGDAFHGSPINAMLCVDDALCVISTVEAQASALAAKLATLSEACRIARG